MKPLLVFVSSLLLFSFPVVNADDHKKPAVKEKSVAQQERAMKAQAKQDMEDLDDEALKEKIKDKEQWKNEDKRKEKLHKAEDKVKEADDDSELESDDKGLEKQREKKVDQVRNETDKGSEKGQEKRAENSKKWWKFWE